MTAFLLQYLPIVIFLGIAAVIGIVFLLAAAVLAPKAPDPEKLSAFECGFNAFDDARMKFDIRFYLVSILRLLLRWSPSPNPGPTTLRSLASAFVSNLVSEAVST
jgi:NADH:ubiquinone oxidoreductase subunit 3 (subunit A)